MNATNKSISARGTNDANVVVMENDPGCDLSCLVDGESTVDDLPRLLHLLEGDEVHQQTFQRYQLIGDVMRGSSSQASVGQPHTFLAGIHARLDAPSVEKSDWKPSLATHSRPRAANDDVFRWKLMASVASLAAVFAVSWSVIGTASDGAGGRAGPKMALTQPSQIVGIPADAAMPALVVNTPQGVVLRDARLEELLTEHRQYGGMSALQMPAGFLRDATHQSSLQR